MTFGNESRPASSSSSEGHVRLLYESLEQYNEEGRRRSEERRRRKRRPSIVSYALLVLFLSSATGIALGIGLMAKEVQIGAGATISLSRDVVLFAGFLSLLYACIHIRGARKDYRRTAGHQGPPQSYGNYLHASAILVSRLGILTWIIALVTTVVVITRAMPSSEGFAAKVPVLNVVICVCAIPSCLVISITVERSPTPFATAVISPSSSLVTCRISEFDDDDDDLATYLSVSRRTSLQRKQSSSRTPSILTIPTEMFWSRGGLQYDDEDLGQQPKPRDFVAETTHQTPMSEKQPTLPEWIPHSPLSLTPSLPYTPTLDPTPPMHTVPQPVYYPGGWRTDWNEAEKSQEIQEQPCVVEYPTVGPLSAHPPYLPPASINDNTTHHHHHHHSYYPPQSTTIARALTPSLPLSLSSPPPITPFPLLPPPQPQPQQTTTTTNAIVVTIPSRIPSPTPTPSPQKQQQQQQQPQRRPPAAASTSIANQTARSNLSTVRYASEPEVAVRQPIRVVRNPAYNPPPPPLPHHPLPPPPPHRASTSPARMRGGNEEKENTMPVSVSEYVRMPDPVVLLRNAQRAQKNVTGGIGGGVVSAVKGPRPQPPSSNFSRPGRR